MPLIRLPNASLPAPIWVAGPTNDLKEQQVAEVQMDVRGVSYFNLCALTMLQAYTTGRLTHVKFVPDVASSLLYVLPAQADEYGAVIRCGNTVR